MAANPHFAVQNFQGHVKKGFEMYTQFWQTPSKRLTSHALIHFVYCFNTPVHFTFYFFVALRPNAGHGLLILEVSRSHITTHHSR
jgi:hypothetical protein